LAFKTLLSDIVGTISKSGTHFIGNNGMRFPAELGASAIRASGIASIVMLQQAANS
jgi:hypothetical protein